jgi:RimJ/RimL family protein N-acetyltransferase
VLAYQSDPRYLRFYHWEQRNEPDVRAFVQGFVNSQQITPRRTYQLAITRRDGGRLIGNCGIRIKSAEGRIADLGYELDPEEWGQGFATEAARALLDFGFGVLKLHRIWANCDAENVASARVLEKIGMRREGCLRENEWIKGRWRDMLLYAILEQEYHAGGRQGE